MAEARSCKKSYLDYFKYYWHQQNLFFSGALNILDFIESLLSVSGETKFLIPETNEYVKDCIHLINMNVRCLYLSKLRESLGVAYLSDTNVLYLPKLQ